MAWKMRRLSEDARIAFSQVCFVCYSAATILCYWGYHSGRWNAWVLACAVMFSAIGILGHGSFAFAGDIGASHSAAPGAGAAGGRSDGLRNLLATHSVSAAAIALTLLLLPDQ